MNLKKLATLLIYIIVLNSCAQKKHKTMTQNNKVTVDNFNQRMKEEVKLYEEQPMYLLRVNQEYCTYEVLVNDFLVEKHYTRGKDATGIKINRAILKSGEQTVTIRMYPFGNLLQKAFGDDEPYFDTLKGGSAVQVEVVKIADWKNYDIANEEIIKVHQTEGLENNKFPGAGLPYYEFTFTFIAKVPYVNEGWSNGIDLREIDSTILRKKVWDYFKMYQKYYEEKSIDKILGVNFNKNVREVTANYFAHQAHDGDKIFDELKEQYLDGVMIEDKQFLPLKNYELAFFGDGKIVTFKKSSLHTVEKKYRGKSALQFIFKRKGEGYRRMKSPYIYLYINKDNYNGMEEDIQLEMIK